MDFDKELIKCRTIPDIFELVKWVVAQYTNKDQAGLLVGLADLGMHAKGFVGAFYSLNSNSIIINKKPLNKIQMKNSYLFKPYIFHILLHEYIHSLGCLDETETRNLTYNLSKKLFGANHLTTQLAKDMGKFLPKMSLPSDFEEPENLNIDYLLGIDKRNTNYIM